MTHLEIQRKIKIAICKIRVFRGINIDLQLYCLFPGRIFPKK